MPVCSHIGYTGSSGLGARNASNYLMVEDGLSVLQPQVAALFVLADDVSDKTLDCNYSFLSGADYARVVGSAKNFGGSMPTCLKRGYAGSVGIGVQSATNYLMDSTGAAATTPNVLAKFLLVDTVTVDVSQCEAIALSGAEYAALAFPTTPGSNVNVSAEIFVGAALVAIFILGWIAGAQR